MATGGTLLVLVLCLRPGLLVQDIGLGEPNTMLAAPARLIALVSDAVKATVAAGETESGPEDLAGVTMVPTTNAAESVAVETPEEVIEHAGGNVARPVQIVTVGGIEDNSSVLAGAVETATSGYKTGEGKTPSSEEVLIVGDTRYEWQEWSHWHCNCPAGSMSRVRDITYSVPGVHLDPVQYNVLRFEREVCSYKTCLCSRKAHECDRLEVTCNESTPHICALRDIEHDQEKKRKLFWAQLHSGLKDLWHSMKETFTHSIEDTTPKSGK